MITTAPSISIERWNAQSPDATALSARYNCRWSVLPLDSDKRPVKTGGMWEDGNPKRLKWKHLQERLPTEQEIRKWQKQYSPPAWAIITGALSGRIVLDFDGEAGQATLKRLGLDPHVRTGSGGHHVHFKHPGWFVQTLNNKSSKDRPWAKAYPGLDIRADGGYAAICGSNESGPYEWLREPIPDDLSLLPADLRRFLGLLEPPDAAPEAMPPAARPRVVSSGNLPDILLDRAVDRIGMEGRDNAAFWLACQLRDNQVPSAESVMRAYARRVPSTNTKGQVEAFTEADALAKLASADTRPARAAWEAKTVEYKPSRHATGNGNGNGNHTGNTPTPGKASWSFNRTDYGNAERLVARHGRNMRYCHAMNSWLIWNEQQWVEDKTGEAERLAKETVRSIYTETSNTSLDKEGEAERKAITAHATKSESKARIRDMLILAQSEHSIPVKREQLDADPWLLNVSNGTIDLHTGQLREHIPADLITKCLTTPYIPDAPCPLWHSFLNTIFDGNTDLISFMQRALGYALTGDTGEQCFFLLYGRGHNGKSTLLEVVQAILGDYAQSAEFKAFLARDNEGIRNDIARMNGKRLVVAKESDKGRHLAEALVKQLTGGDTITARFLHQEFFDFRPQFKLFLAANHKPEIKGTDLGIWRRVRLVPFTVTIPEDKKDKDLPRKLAQEALGILAWLVQGCVAWQRDGLRMPEVVQEATTSYKAEMNVAARFLDGSCDFGKGKKVLSSTLKEAFRSWCEDVSDETYDPKQLQAVLLERSCTNARGTGGKYVWHGVELKSEPPTPESEPPGGLFEHKSEPSEPSEPKKGNLPFEGETNGKLPDSTSLGSLGSLFEYPFDAIKLACPKPLTSCRVCHRDQYVPRLKGEQWIWACGYCHPEVARAQGREYIDTLDRGK